MNSPDVQVAVQLEQIKQVVSEASDIVAAFFRNGASVDRKRDGSLITEADTSANEFLKGALPQICPVAAWLSEETADDPIRLKKDWVWIVDPLDGTKEFVSGIPEFAISVGLAHGGRALAGAVVNPATGEGAVGGLGLGIECWGCTRQDRHSDALASACASVSRTEVDDGSALPYLGLVGSATTIGSVAYKLLRVALGHDDFTFSVQHKSVWDVCGGIALLEAAGKVYRRFDGVAVAFNARDTRIRSGAAAGGAALVDQFVGHVTRLGRHQLE